MHDEWLTISSFLNENPSGLWHQVHRKGHPLKKTNFRIPGPSCTANSSMLKMIPFDILN
jgi:hypothetical protein